MWHASHIPLSWGWPAGWSSHSAKSLLQTAGFACMWLQHMRTSVASCRFSMLLFLVWFVKTLWTLHCLPQYVWSRSARGKVVGVTFAATRRRLLCQVKPIELCPRVGFARNVWGIKGRLSNKDLLGVTKLTDNANSKLCLGRSSWKIREF